MSVALNHPWVDASRGRLMLVRFPTHASNDEVRAFYADLVRWYEHLETVIGWVVNIDGILRAPSEQRRIAGEAVRLISPHASRWSCGTGYVASSGLARGLLVAVYWASPPAYPYKVFAMEHVALDWVAGRLNHRLNEREATLMRRER